MTADDVLECREWEPAKGQACSITTALIIAGAAAAAGGLAHDIQGFVSGQTPWGNPGQWVTGALKAGGIGFAGGFLGGALGPALGAVGDALGIGESAGTSAAAAGAPVGGGASASGIIPAEGAAVESIGANAPQSAVVNALANVGRQGLTGAATGALGDMQNPGRGALMGAASGAVSGAINAGGNAIFRGQMSGLVPNSADGATRGFSMGPTGGDSFTYNPDAQPYSLARTTLATPAPTLAERLGTAGTGLAARAGGQAASMAVGNMMSPRPLPPLAQSPYQQQPYWMGPRFT